MTNNYTPTLKQYSTPVCSIQYRISAQTIGKIIPEIDMSIVIHIYTNKPNR